MFVMAVIKQIKVSGDIYIATFPVYRTVNSFPDHIC